MPRMTILLISGGQHERLRFKSTASCNEFSNMRWRHVIHSLPLQQPLLLIRRCNVKPTLDSNICCYANRYRRAPRAFLRAKEKVIMSVVTQCARWMAGAVTGQPTFSSLTSSPPGNTSLHKAAWWGNVASKAHPWLLLCNLRSLILHDRCR